MATFISRGSKFLLDCEFQNFPVSFVNGLRRISLSEIPTVVVRKPEVIANTTQMPHEMITHRMELLPINVDPTDVETIRNAVIELRVGSAEKDQLLTTDDFVVSSAREHIIMKDKDLDTPLLFIKVRAGEEVHVKGSLAVELGSQVCTSSMKYHIDEERARIDREAFVKNGEDSRIFDNFYIQKSYSVDDTGRPNWIDLSIESVGVITSKQILKLAIVRFLSEIDKWMENVKITRESEKNVYSITQEGTHTIGALLQEVIYRNKDTEFVSYDIPHPLRKEMVLRFSSSNKPEDVLLNAKKVIHSYCEIVSNSL
jgi:DNA-directed RNA polymerase subunit L